MIIINISKISLIKKLGKKIFIKYLISYLMTRLLAFKSDKKDEFETDNLISLMNKFEYFVLKKDIDSEDEYLKIKKNDLQDNLDLEIIFIILEKLDFDPKVSNFSLFSKKNKELEMLKKLILFENEKEYFTNFMLGLNNDTINYKMIL